MICNNKRRVLFGKVICSDQSVENVAETRFSLKVGFIRTRPTNRNLPAECHLHANPL